MKKFFSSTTIIATVASVAILAAAFMTFGAGCMCPYGPGPGPGPRHGYEPGLFGPHPPPPPPPR